MSSGIFQEIKPQEKININGNQKVLEPEATSQTETMEPSKHSEESDDREVILSGNFLDLQDFDEIMKTLETRNHTTINDVAHDILMIIFDNLTPCMIACLGLTCRRFYAYCKIHHPGPFNLQLHDTEQHHSVTKKYRPDTICHPLSCVHYSCDHKRLTASEPREDAILIVEISRHQTGSIPATAYPRRDHLADLIETWHGLRHYRKTWPNVGNNGKSKYILKYLLISVYNPSNEHCKLKSALQDRYSDFYQGEPQIPADFGLIWTGSPWPTLPNPHQMTPRDWFLKAKEIILNNRSQHMSKYLWAEIWGGYVVGKNCLDWMKERPYDTFSDWSMECLWRRG